MDSPRRGEPCKAGDLTEIQPTDIQMSDRTSGFAAVRTHKAVRYELCAASTTLATAAIFLLQPRAGVCPLASPKAKGYNIET